MPTTPEQTPADRTIPPTVSATDWERAASNPQFKALMAAKLKFIVPATIFFLVYYLALPILVGYAPKMMSTQVLGPLNLAYLFALSQFFMAWIVAFLYMRAAGKFDRMAQTVIDHLKSEKRGGSL